MKKLMIGILGLTLAVACNSGETDAKVENTENEKTVTIVREDINPMEAQELINSDDVVILDVRSEDEFSSGHLKGAINMDINAEGFNYAIADLENTKKYVVYCQSGRRSAAAMEQMMNVGFTNVYNILGGINEWQGTGFEVVTE